MTDSRRALLFGLLALAHGPLLEAAQHVIPRLLPNLAGSGEGEALAFMVSLLYAAAIAWFAFAWDGSGSRVDVIPRGRSLGVWSVVLFVGFEVFHTYLVFASSPSERLQMSLTWNRPYLTADGDLLLGWVVVSMLAAALAEELVYRALLLRGLEGYLDSRSALVVQALVFELVHLYVYRLPFTGGMWCWMGLIYGHAFQRTRAVAVPTMMHAIHNVLFMLSVWLLSR